MSTNIPRGRRLRRFLFPVVTVLVPGILLPLLFVETGLRLFWGGYYFKDTAGRYRKDALMGWTPSIGFKGLHGGPEFRVTVTHNSKGMRGAEVNTERVHGASRIVFIGDSMTYGYGVEDDETFVSLLGNRIEAADTINLGVEGYSTAQQLLRLRRLGLDLSPDLVVLCLFWNDFYWDNLDSPGPRFELQKGELVQLEYDQKKMDRHRIFRKPSWSKRLLQKSYLYRFASDTLKEFRSRSRDAFMRDYEEKPEEDYHRTWELTEALIAEIASDCSKKGIRFLAVLVPDQVDIETDKRVVGLPPRFEEIESKLEAALFRRGVPFFSPKDCMAAIYQKEEQPLYYTMNRHLTRLGNDSLAGCLEGEILKRLKG